MGAPTTPALRQPREKSLVGYSCNSPRNSTIAYIKVKKVHAENPKKSSHPQFLMPIVFARTNHRRIKMTVPTANSARHSIRASVAMVLKSDAKVDQGNVSGSSQILLKHCLMFRDVGTQEPFMLVWFPYPSPWERGGFWAPGSDLYEMYFLNIPL